MAGGALKTIDPAGYKYAPLRAALLVNVDNSLMHPDGFLSILAGTNAAGTGRHLANLAGAPSVTESDEMVNPYEDLYGRTAPVVGEDQIQSSTTQVSFEIVELSLKNIQMIRPDMSFTQLLGNDGVAASLTIGTGASGVTYTADAKGVAGNSIRVAHVNPGVAASLSVAVSGNDITVTLAHNGTAVTSTAAQVRDAVNANASAAALVNATLPGDGTGVAAVLALTNLTGGVNGSPIGVSMKRTLSLDNNSYLNNFVAVYSTSERTIGGAVILRKARNNSEDREYSFSDDLSVFGVEVTMQAYSESSTIDPETGTILPNVEEHTYSETAVPTALNA